MDSVLEYSVLYTHQKTKKAKTWQDGKLKVNTLQNRASLYDDKGQQLDKLHLKQQLSAGDDLESERYLIQVEELQKSNTASSDPPNSGQSGSSTVQQGPHRSAAHLPYHPARLLQRSVIASGQDSYEKSSQVQGLVAVPGNNGAQNNQPRLAGRRIGLKRKTGSTGFVPPRQFKAPRQDLVTEEPVTALQAYKAKMEQNTSSAFRSMEATLAQPTILFSMYAQGGQNSLSPVIPPASSPNMLNHVEDKIKDKNSDLQETSVNIPDVTCGVGQSISHDREDLDRSVSIGTGVWGSSNYLSNSTASGKRSANQILALIGKSKQTIPTPSSLQDSHGMGDASEKDSSRQLGREMGHSNSDYPLNNQVNTFDSNMEYSVDNSGQVSPLTSAVVHQGNPLWSKTLTTGNLGIGDGDVHKGSPILKGGGSPKKGSVIPTGGGSPKKSSVILTGRGSPRKSSVLKGGCSPKVTTPTADPLILSLYKSISPEISYPIESKDNLEFRGNHELSIADKDSCDDKLSMQACHIVSDIGPVAEQGQGQSNVEECTSGVAADVDAHNHVSDIGIDRLCDSSKVLSSPIPVFISQESDASQTSQDYGLFAGLPSQTIQDCDNETSEGVDAHQEMKLINLDIDCEKTEEQLQDQQVDNRPSPVSSSMSTSTMAVTNSQLSGASSEYDFHKLAMGGMDYSPTIPLQPNTNNTEKAHGTKQEEVMRSVTQEFDYCENLQSKNSKESDIKSSGQLPLVVTDRTDIKSEVQIKTSENAGIGEIEYENGSEKFSLYDSNSIKADISETKGNEVDTWAMEVPQQNDINRSSGLRVCMDEEQDAQLKTEMTEENEFGSFDLMEEDWSDEEWSQENSKPDDPQNAPHTELAQESSEPVSCDPNTLHRVLPSPEIGDESLSTNNTQSQVASSGLSTTDTMCSTSQETMASDLDFNSVKSYGNNVDVPLEIQGISEEINACHGAVAKEARSSHETNNVSLEGQPHRLIQQSHEYSSDRRLGVGGSMAECDLSFSDGSYNSYTGRISSPSCVTEQAKHHKGILETDGVTMDILHSSLSSLPHPSELIAGEKQVIKGDAPSQSSDIVSLASAKLSQYELRGMLSSGVVRRKDTNGMTVCGTASHNQVVVRRDEQAPRRIASLVPAEASDGERSSSMWKDQRVGSHPGSPALPETTYDNSSLYYPNPLANKVEFSHEKQFCVTPQDFLPGAQAVSSPSQQVPGLTSTHQDSPLSVSEVPQSTIIRSRERKPMKSQPYSDMTTTGNDQLLRVDQILPSQSCDMSHSFKVSQLSKNAGDHFESQMSPEHILSPIRATALSDAVPVWMQDSPGDFSISESPLLPKHYKRAVTLQPICKSGMDGPCLRTATSNYKSNLRPAVLTYGVDSKESLSRPSWGHVTTTVSSASSDPFRMRAAGHGLDMKQAQKQPSYSRRESLRDWNSDWDSPEMLSPMDEEFELGKENRQVNGISKWNRFQCEEKPETLPVVYHGRFSPCRKGSRNLSNDMGKSDPVKHSGEMENSYKHIHKNFVESQDQPCLDSRSINSSFSMDMRNTNTPPKIDTEPMDFTPGHSLTPTNTFCNSERASLMKKPAHHQQFGTLHKSFKTPRLVSGNDTTPRATPGSCAPQHGSPDTPGRAAFSTPRTVQLRSGSLRFLGQSEIANTDSSQRQCVIPPEFSSHTEYRQVLTGVLQEYMNVHLYVLAKTYFSTLAQVDISAYNPGNYTGTATGYGRGAEAAKSTNPVCEHGNASKMIQVKKEGPNKGRFFFACAGKRDAQCKFFQWSDQSKGKQHAAAKAIGLSDCDSITTFFKGQGLPLYCECQLLRKSKDSYKTHLKNIPSWVKKKMQLSSDCEKKCLFLKLSRKEASAAYTKEDLWVIASDLSFSDAFLAKSVFYGPRAGNELEIEPLANFSPSNWPSGMLCYALHAGNFSTELDCIDNIEAHVQPSALPILPSLLHLSSHQEGSSHAVSGGFSAPKMQAKPMFHVPQSTIDVLVADFIDHYELNEDQASSLSKVANMFAPGQQAYDSLSLVHGVFGAGKSYLLAVMVLFLVALFDANESHTPDVPVPLRVLISSTTNVAVDRILLGLLQLEFDEFVRVGSMKKIAKPVLPYSVHAVGSDSTELKELQDILKSDLTPSEKVHVRKSIEQHKRGENKKKLTSVRVVGVTCAASAFKCLKDFVFPVVLLDECSQMTEPMSLLPIARFQCAKLVLVGDPKQLEPTISGPEATHKDGLEQTLFDRLQKMGHPAIMLRTQYRCHPRISAIPNDLFYSGQLRDGITEAHRSVLVPDWPTLCFFDVPKGSERMNASGSFYNEEEAKVVTGLIDILVGYGVACESIGVITLYKAQLVGFSQLMQARSELRGVQISTVDAFQGGEREIILLSCVRTHHVGFIDCHKRMNVALSRAKNHLLIVGHQQNLRKNSIWSRVLEHCRANEGGIQNGPVFLEHQQFALQRLNEENQDDHSGRSAASNKGPQPKRKRKTRLPEDSQDTFGSMGGSPYLDLSDSESVLDCHNNHHLKPYDEAGNNYSSGQDGSQESLRCHQDQVNVKAVRKKRVPCPVVAGAEDFEDDVPVDNSDEDDSDLVPGI